MSSQLENGEYLIRSRANGSIVGRALREDKSGRPKAIIAVPDAGGPDQWWLVESYDGGKYGLSIRGSTTCILDGRVFAIPTDTSEPEKWVIEKQACGGYTIESPDLRGGWVLPDDKLGTQVAFRPLIVGPSEPPFFPPNELWDVIPANNN